MNLQNRKRPAITKLVSDQKIPKFFKAKQIFERPCIGRSYIEDTVFKTLNRDLLKNKIKPDMSIAITVGSRGINNIDEITKSIVNFVKKQGANPFIIPAMGSHGGATAEGQKEMIAGFGVTEETMGCPVKSSMEVVPIGKNAEGIEVFIDKYAYEADGIIVSARVKPHTAFRGDYESGLLKMMAIGLGKQYGAEVCHESGFHNMAKNIQLFGRTILDNSNILFGLAILENAYDETYRLEGIDSSEIFEKEPELLKDAYAHMPRILVDDCDVLLVDEIGKNFSGDGMDPNISGRFIRTGISGGINAQKVGLFGLSEVSHGNAIGIGLAEAMTERIANDLDLNSMYMNSITNTTFSATKIPMIMESDKELIQVLIKTCNEIDKENPRIIRIKNTLHIGEILMSEAYLNEIKDIDNLEIASDLFELEFDENGDLW